MEKEYQIRGTYRAGLFWGADGVYRQVEAIRGVRCLEVNGNRLGLAMSCLPGNGWVDRPVMSVS